MTFYLTSIQIASHVKTTEPIKFHNNLDDAVIFGKWVIDACALAHETGSTIQVGTACLKNHHWFPLIAHVSEHRTSFTTTVEAAPFITSMIQTSFAEDEHSELIGPVSTVVQSSVFPADCGFQSLAHVLNQVREGPQEVPMPAKEAIEWKVLFAQYLRNMELDRTLVTALDIGGANDHQRHQELCKLLEEHGVAAKRSHAAATQLLNAIGTQGIAASLKSPKPWRDLKAKANQCQPPIQIVLSDELQSQIEQLAENKQFGSKQNKKQKTRPQGPRAQIDLQLKADQIKLPDGIWTQGDQTLLRQISTHQVQLKQCGIAVMNYDEALPYIQLQEPISDEGLAIIILDQPGLTLPDKCTRISLLPTSSNWGRSMSQEFNRPTRLRWLKLTHQS